MGGPPLASVREPILTMTRRARATTARGSVAVMVDEIVESGIQAPSELFGNAGHALQNAVDQRGGGIRVVVVAPPRTLGLDADRDGTNERSVDRGADAGRLFGVDGELLARSVLRKVPVEEATQNVRLHRSANGPHEAHRAESPQCAESQLVSHDS